MQLKNLINRIKEINPNIKLRFKGEFDENNKRTGYWERYYHKNGNISSKGNYLNDLKHGYWKEYYDNGNLYSKGNYLNGLEDGYWERYHDNGNILSKGNYINGEYNGYWQ